MKKTSLIQTTRDWVGRFGLKLVKNAYGPSVAFSQYTGQDPYDWQRDVSPAGEAGDFGPVSTAITTIAQDLSRIPIRHVREHPDGSYEPITTKAPTRFFRSPNHYMTLCDWVRRMAEAYLSTGRSYALAVRNDRFEAVELYPLRPDAVWPYIDQTTGEVLYQVATDDSFALAQPNVKDGLWVPQHNMLDIRLSTPGHPLIGVSPVQYYTTTISTGAQLNRHTDNFFRNMGRVSGYLKIPGELDDAQMALIKKRWKETSSGARFGDIAVLTNEASWSPMVMNAVDSELIKTYQLAERQIFQAYRIPPAMYGDTEKSQFREVESVLRFYYQSCLHYYSVLMEQALTNFWRLPADEHIEFEFDKALLQSDFKTRVDAYKSASQSGWSINEIRKDYRLPPAKHGDEPRLQQQMVPLSFGADPANQPGVAPVPPAPEPDPDDEEARTMAMYNYLKAGLGQT